MPVGTPILPFLAIRARAHRTPLGENDRCNKTYNFDIK